MSALKKLQKAFVKSNSAVACLSYLQRFFFGAEFVSEEDLLEVTRLAEEMLNRMVLLNDSFVFRSGIVAVAAIDVRGSRDERELHQFAS